MWHPALPPMTSPLIGRMIMRKRWKLHCKLLPTRLKPLQYLHGLYVFARKIYAQTKLFFSPPLFSTPSPLQFFTLNPTPPTMPRMFQCPKENWVWGLPQIDIWLVGGWGLVGAGWHSAPILHHNQPLFSHSQTLKYIYFLFYQPRMVKFADFPCQVLSFLVWSVSVLFVLSCPVLSCPVLSCPVLSCPVLSCPVLSCPVLFCSALFCSGLFLSCLVLTILQTGTRGVCPLSVIL